MTILDEFADQIRAVLPTHAHIRPRHGVAWGATWTTPAGTHNLDADTSRLRATRTLSMIKVDGPGYAYSLIAPHATADTTTALLRLLGAIEPAPIEQPDTTWRDYTVEPDGDHPGAGVLCRSDDTCMEAEVNAPGRYLTLGEAVDWAQKHDADHARWDAEVAADAAGEHPDPSRPIGTVPTPVDAEAQQHIAAVIAGGEPNDPNRCEAPQTPGCTRPVTQLVEYYTGKTALVAGEPEPLIRRIRACDPCTAGIHGFISTARLLPAFTADTAQKAPSAGR